MYSIEGILKNVLTQRINSAKGDFDITILQIEGKASNGRIILEDIKVGKEKLSKVEELRSYLGKEVKLPVAVIVNKGYKNVYLQ